MNTRQPLVAVVVGSDSDLETMKRCLDQLDQFAVPYEVRVISAHRTGRAAHEYAASAAERGLKVIIAAAGMSAALSGVMAGGTVLPVVGVPISAGPLAGIDAALSTMQMPPGVPVACMSIGPAGATNAAIFAAQILALGDGKIAARLKNFKETLAKEVADKDAKLQESLAKGRD